MKHSEFLKHAHVFFPLIGREDVEVTPENCMEAINLDTYGDMVINSIANKPDYEQKSRKLVELNGHNLYIVSAGYLHRSINNAKFYLVAEWDSEMDFTPCGSISLEIMPISTDYNVGELLSWFLLEYDVL